jgi:hypothetical protein
MKKILTTLTLTVLATYNYANNGNQIIHAMNNDSIPKYESITIEKNHFFNISFGLAFPTNKNFKKDPNFAGFDNGTTHPYSEGKVAGKRGWTTELGGLYLLPSKNKSKINFGIKYGMSFTLLKMDWDDMVEKKSSYSIIRTAFKDEKARNFNITSIKFGPSISYKINDNMSLDGFYNIGISRIRGGYFYASEYATSSNSWYSDEFSSSTSNKSYKLNLSSHFGVNLRLFQYLAVGIEFSTGLKNKNTYYSDHSLYIYEPWTNYSSTNSAMKSKLNLSNLAFKVAYTF